MGQSDSQSSLGVRVENDSNHSRTYRRNESRDPGLHRWRVPRSESVPGIRSWYKTFRDSHSRVLRQSIANPERNSTGEIIDTLNQPYSRLDGNDLVRLLLVVEGMNDIEFLRRISLMLHASDARLPNLAEMERQGELIFVPFGGGHVRAWADRLAPLGRPEFHLYDHELPPETEFRQHAAETVNQRLQCKAVITKKRCLENYLHPNAIFAAGGIRVHFDDFDCVAELTARELYRQRPGEVAWQLQARRSQSRMSNRAKRWLNTLAVEHMTVAMLNQRDRAGEIVSWMQAINELLASSPHHITTPKEMK